MIVNFGHQLDKLTLELVRGATRGQGVCESVPERINYEGRARLTLNVMIAFQGLPPPPDTPYIQVSSFWWFTEFAHDWSGLLPQSCLLIGKHKMIMCLYTTCWDTWMKWSISLPPALQPNYVTWKTKDRHSTASAQGLRDYSGHDRAATVLRTKPRVSPRSSGPFWFRPQVFSYWLVYTH